VGGQGYGNLEFKAKRLELHDQGNERGEGDYINWISSRNYIGK
jgi:ribosomal protein S17